LVMALATTGWLCDGMRMSAGVTSEWGGEGLDGLGMGLQQVGVCWATFVDLWMFVEHGGAGQSRFRCFLPTLGVCHRDDLFVWLSIAVSHSYLAR